MIHLLHEHDEHFRQTTAILMSVAPLRRITIERDYREHMPQLYPAWVAWRRAHAPESLATAIEGR